MNRAPSNWREQEAASHTVDVNSVVITFTRRDNKRSGADRGGKKDTGHLLQKKQQ